MWTLFPVCAQRPRPRRCRKFKEGSGIYGAVAVGSDASGHAAATALAIAKGVGSTRVGTIKLSFQHETEGDNFEEQVLYGGAIQLMRSIYKVMMTTATPHPLPMPRPCGQSAPSSTTSTKWAWRNTTRRASRTCEFAVRTSGPRVINEDAIQQILKKRKKAYLPAIGLTNSIWACPPSTACAALGRFDMERTGKLFRDKFGMS